MGARLRAVRPASRLALALAAGCYTYVPVDRAAAPGTEVRIELGDPVPTAVERVLGRGTAVVEGRVTALEDTAVVLSVSRTVRRDSTEATWGGETVTLPRAVIRDVGARRLDRRRTVLFGAAVAGAIALVMAVVARAEGGGSGSGPPVGGPTPP
jgi:hypothetical protein